MSLTRQFCLFLKMVTLSVGCVITPVFCRILIPARLVLVDLGVVVRIRQPVTGLKESVS